MNFLKNMNIGTRLGFGFAVMFALSILIAVIGIVQLQAVADETGEMMDQPLAKERMIADWYSKIDSAIRRTTAIAKSSDDSLSSYFAEEAAASTKRVNGLLDQIEPLLLTGEEKQVYEKIGAQRKIYYSARNSIADLKKEGQVEEADQIFQTVFVPAANLYQNLVQELLDMQRKAIDGAAVNIETAAATSRHFLVGIAIFVLVFGVLCAWWLTSGITRPLQRAVDAARRVADGDLSGAIVVDSTDEPGQLLHALNEMNHNLAHIVSNVRSGTDSIATAASQIAAGNMDLSSRTEEQASSLEQTAASMEELTSTVKQNADNARQANQLAMSASEVARKGGIVVSQVVETMVSINDSSKRIVDIISVIDGIAFQTNILALNAAVEAARAGEQGRGFAVVATEVRNLAQRSAAAAREIKSLIGDSVDKVAIGSKLVDEAGSTMAEVVTSVRRVTDIMSEITAASQEQSAGIEQVNLAIAQMDEVTQQNAALVEEAAAAAESLQNQAEALSQVVGSFQLSEYHHVAVQEMPGAVMIRNSPVLRTVAPARRIGAGITSV